MILVAADVWLKSIAGQAPAISAKVSELLRLGLVLGHQFVLGELMLDGRLPSAKGVIDRYTDLEQAEVLPFESICEFVKTRALTHKGLTWEEASILASAHQAKAQVWATSGALATVAGELDLAYTEANS